MHPVIVIPAYQPQQNLVDVVNSLIAGGAPQIVVVNDGSSDKCKPIFEQLAQMNGVTILHHAVNQGKGAALKTAFNYALVHIQGLSGIMTADADGQHMALDVLNLTKCFNADANCLWLGSREFEGNVPFRSRFGNGLTKKVFRFFIGKSLIDTQTGLRGIPTQLLKEMLKVSANGYEFELEMLIVASNSGITIKEMPIKTVYEDGNKSSHFNPIIDSIKIYFVFIRFSALSIITAMIDFIAFISFYSLTSSIVLSVAGSRLIAGTFNFTCSKYLVFRSNKYYLPELLKYCFTVGLLMVASFVLIEILVEEFGFAIILSKIFAESALFLVSFAIQRTYIFGSSEQKTI